MLTRYNITILLKNFYKTFYNASIGSKDSRIIEPRYIIIFHTVPFLLTLIYMLYYKFGHTGLNKESFILSTLLFFLYSLLFSMFVIAVSLFKDFYLSLNKDETDPIKDNDIIYIIISELYSQSMYMFILFMIYIPFMFIILITTNNSIIFICLSWLIYLTNLAIMVLLLIIKRLFIIITYQSKI